MSPRSRGRPPGRGRRRQPRSRTAKHRAFGVADEEIPDCWFENPIPGDRSSWAIPRGHGIYQGIDLGLLDRGDDDELMILLEAMHDVVDYRAPGGSEDAAGDGEPVSPSLHAAMHHAVARQILADEPPATWQTVQRLAGLGYDWHNIMHMIAELVAHDVHAALAEHKRPDPADYRLRLNRLPGAWPPPEELR
jgi:hypothetical protein